MLGALYRYEESIQLIVNIIQQAIIIVIFWIKWSIYALLFYQSMTLLGVDVMNTRQTKHYNEL